MGDSIVEGTVGSGWKEGVDVPTAETEMKHTEQAHQQDVQMGESLPEEYSGHHVDTVGENEPHTAKEFCEEVGSREKQQGEDQHHPVVPVQDEGERGLIGAS